MLELYGHAWASQFGDGAGEELNDAQRRWARVLRGLTMDQIAHGVELLEKRPDKWPPNAGEFRALCLEYRPRQRGKRLPELPADRESALAYISELKRELRKGGCVGDGL